LKYERGVKVSETARDLQLIANSWHIQQGRSLARGDSYRWAAYAALLLAVVLFTFSWLGWAKTSLLPLPWPQMQRRLRFQGESHSPLALCRRRPVSRGCS